MNTKILQSLGLTEREAEVYLILLDTGSTTTGQIIKKSGLHKATVYSILQRLIDQGMVSYVVKDGIRFFEAADPENLLDVLREREENLLEILPDLKKKKELAKQKQEAYVLEGVKGIKTARDRSLKILNKGEEILILGASPFSHKPLESYWESYHNRRVKAGIRARLLWSESIRKLGKEREKLGLTESKYLPKELETPADIDIFGNIVDIRVFAEKPFLFHIENKTLADSFRNYFNLLWNRDVKIYKGFDAVTEKFASMMDEMKIGDEYFVLGAGYGFGGKKLRDWFADYHKERIRRKIKANLLCIPEYFEEIKNLPIHAGDPEMKITGIKRLPFKFSSPMQINLYRDNKVLMFLWEKEEMVCFEIESPTLYKNFKAYFDGLWDPETETLRGFGPLWENHKEFAQTGEEVYFIGARGYYFDKHPENLKIFENLLIKNGTKIKNIVDFGAKKNPFLKIKNQEVRYVSNEFLNPNVIWIYSKKVAITQWTEKEPILLIINNKNVYEAHKKQFELLWKSSKS